MVLSCIKSLTHIILTIVAVIQAMFSCLLLLLVSLILFYFGNAVDAVNKYVYVADILSGTNASGQIDAVVGFFKFLVFGIFFAYFLICVFLCKGLCEHKPWMIMIYVICGGCILGVRASLLTSYEVHHFREDPSLYYCVGYGAYLLALFFNFVDMLQEQSRLRKRHQFVSAKDHMTTTI